MLTLSAVMALFAMPGAGGRIALFLGSFMLRIHALMLKTVFWLLCLPALLASCATVPPSTPAEGEQPTAPAQPYGRQPAPQPPAAKIPSDQWPPLRARIASALGEVAGITVQAADDGSLHVNIPSAQGFAPDSDEPQATLTAALDGIAPKLAAYPQTAVHIVGHTDSMGSELYNLRLSIRRAEAVMEYLRRQGVALARLSADGKGEAEPIADNGSPTERVKNRRVELVIRPLE